MNNLQFSKSDGVAVVSLARGKVNAIEEALSGQLSECLEQCRRDDSVRAIALTGQGKFFSFGFDIPHFIDYSREDFGAFLTIFNDLCRDIFLYPKPVIAALNGHTVAGGCVLAMTADYRVIVEGFPKVALNEISLGASIFARSVEMLKFTVGGQKASKILYTGDMYTVDEAVQLGLVDHVCTEDKLMTHALEIAKKYASKEPGAFAHTKHLLRGKVVEGMEQAEADSIERFLDLWYSDAAQAIIRKVEIRS